VEDTVGTINQQAPDAKAIRTPTILIVGEGCKRLLSTLSECDLGRNSMVAASNVTALKLFKAANVVLVVLDCATAADAWLGRAMKRWNAQVPMIVIAHHWSALELMEFGDVLLSRSAEHEVLGQHVKAQLEATRRLVA
jgi:hypothetical protein